jgi:hypothetical protein
MRLVQFVGAGHHLLVAEAREIIAYCLLFL